MKNPTRRSIMQWVMHKDVAGKSHTVLNLNGSKRYGPAVSHFLANVLPSCCAKLYSSQVAHNTELIHVWYAGVWCSLKGQTNWKYDAQPLIANWNSTLIANLLHAVAYDLNTCDKAPTTGGGTARQPILLVICFLKRHAVSIQWAIEQFLDGLITNNNYTKNDVNVVLVDSVRGLTTRYAHIVHGDRFVDGHDQFFGIQSCERREYLVYTRATHRTTMWLDTQPFGHPGNTFDQKFGTRLSKGKALALKRHQHIRDNRLPYFVFEASELWRGVDQSSVSVPILDGALWRATQDLSEQQIKSTDISERGDLYSAFTELICKDGKYFPFIQATLGNVRSRGIDTASYAKPQELVDPDFDSAGNESLAAAASFCFCIANAVTASISDETEYCTLALPVIPARGLQRLGAGGLPEKGIRAFLCLCYTLLRIHKPATANFECCAVLHKAEIEQVLGHLWWVKACKSNREASVLRDPNKTKKSKQLYMYLGGGGLTEASSYETQGVVVRCRNFTIAAIVLAALQLLSSCLPGDTIEMNSQFFIGNISQANTPFDDAEDDEDQDLRSPDRNLLSTYREVLLDLLEKGFPINAGFSTEREAMIAYRNLHAALKDVYGPAKTAPKRDSSDESDDELI